MIPLLGPILAKPAVAGVVSALSRVPAWVWKLIAASVVLLALRWHWIGVGEDQTKALWDEAEAGYAAAAAAHAAEVRTIEARWRSDYDAAVSRLNKENTDALAERDGLLADLRAGNVRLRDKFRCPRGGVSGATGSAAGGDGPEGGGLSIEDASFFIRESNRADEIVRQLRSCQDVLRAAADNP